MEPAAAAVKARRSIARTRKVDYGIAEKYAAAETLLVPRCAAAAAYHASFIAISNLQSSTTQDGTRQTWEVIVSGY